MSADPELPFGDEWCRLADWIAQTIPLGPAVAISVFRRHPSGQAHVFAMDVLICGRTGRIAVDETEFAARTASGLRRAIMERLWLAIQSVLEEMVEEKEAPDAEGKTTPV